MHDPRDPGSLCNDIVTAIGEDGPDRLWIGTKGGLSRLDRISGRCESLVSRLDGVPGSGLSDNIVNCVHKDGRGIAWIGTNAGLDRFDGSKGEWRTFGLKDGLAGDIVCAIQEDASGALWVSTNRGLARFDPDLGTGKTFGVRDGLQGGAFNPGASAKDADGLLFFGGTNGFNGFDPAGIGKSPFIPPVVWTGLFRNNIEVALPGSYFALRHVKLPRRAPLITLEFAALAFAAPEMNSFAYRLEPRDRQWTSMIPDHRVTLAGLTPGRYTLRVIAANPDGVWNETGIAIGLDLPRPFWKTWWFPLVGLALLAAGAALRRRIRKRAKAAPLALDGDLEAALGTYDLTGRETEIMRLVLQGSSNKDIERRLFISASTVRNHIYNVYQKLGVGSRLELIHRISKEAREKRGKPEN